MKYKFFLLPVISLFFIFSTSFTSDKVISRDLPDHSGIHFFKHYHMFHNSQPWYDAYFCKHWISTEVEFDWDGVHMPTNIVIHQGVEIKDCHHVISNYARTVNTMTFDTDAHISGLAFDPSGDPLTDSKLSSPGYIATMISEMNDIIDGL